MGFSHGRRGVLLGAGTALCILLGGALVGHHYAPLYAPELVIAWSPSCDHISRAIVLQHYGPAGCDRDRVRVWSARCSNAGLARLYRQGDAQAFRAGLLLAHRVDEPGARGQSACTMVRDLIASESPGRVSDLIGFLPRGDRHTIDLVAGLIDHPHPQVALSAVWASSPFGTRVQLPPTALAALRRSLTYRTRSPAGEVRTPDLPPEEGPGRNPRRLSSYLPMLPTRAMTAPEIAQLEANVADAAWNALVQNQPDVACAEARMQWERLSDGRRRTILSALGRSDERAVGFLADRATDGGALAEVALTVLAEMATGGTRQGTTEWGTAEAFLAAVDVLSRDPGRRSPEIEQRLRLCRYRARALTQIATQLPRDQRALALDLLNPNQSSTLHTCFDQPTKTSP